VTLTPANFTRRAANALLAALTLSAGIALAAEPIAPKVKFATSEGDFVVEVYPDGRKLSPVRQGQALRRHRLSPRDQQLHGAGRRL